MPGRTNNSTQYRYGFNGKEKDQNGEFGSITNYDYGARIYNPAIGRWLSMDPENQFVLSQYLAFANNPVLLLDSNGGWVPGVDNNGRIFLRAEEGDDIYSLFKFLGGVDNAKKYLPTFYTKENIIPTIKISTKTMVRFNSDNIFSEAMAQKESNPEYFYDTHPDDVRTARGLPDTYNCHRSAVNASQGCSFIGEGALDPNVRNSELGTAISSDEAVFGETIITFGDDHSATFFGRSKDGTVYVFSKHGDFWSPNIEPVGAVVNGGEEDQVPGSGFGHVRPPGQTSDTIKSHDKNINKDGTSKIEKKGGYYNPIGY